MEEVDFAPLPHEAVASAIDATSAVTANPVKAFLALLFSSFMTRSLSLFSAPLPLDPPSLYCLRPSARRVHHSLAPGRGPWTHVDPKRRKLKTFGETL
ncbi:MAG: hypothetical protein QME88_07420 [Actinomycetota bacterium]|nr:hypothetical protein [Actinomycetota bacterium]